MRICCDWCSECRAVKSLLFTTVRFFMSFPVRGVRTTGDELPFSLHLIVALLVEGGRREVTVSNPWTPQQLTATTTASQ